MQAKDDAEKCVLDFIGKPDVFIMDHLLKLKPVEVLAGQPIHQVIFNLSIFAILKISIDFIFEKIGRAIA